MTPKRKMSDLQVSDLRACACSGDMWPNVPHAMFGALNVAKVVCLATPRSMSTARPESASITFEGLISRCTMRRGASHSASIAAATS